MVTLRLFGGMVIEPAFYDLPNVQQAAILCHEEGHRRKRHLWVRLFKQFTLSDADYSALMHAQEFEADAFAAQHGHASALANVLRRTPEAASRTHPSTKDRVARLLM